VRALVSNSGLVAFEVAHHERRDLVHEARIGEKGRPAKHGDVGHGLHAAHGEERCHIEVVDDYLVSVRLEVRTHERHRLLLHAFDVFHAPDAGDLLYEDAVEPRFDAMCLDHDANELAGGVAEWKGCDAHERGLDDVHHLADVPFDYGSDEGLLAREVLIQRADADPGGLGDLVGARVVVPELDENASGCGEECVDGRPRSLL
jgi:hypothetical protein